MGHIWERETDGHVLGGAELSGCLVKTRPSDVILWDVEPEENVDV